MFSAAGIIIYKAFAPTIKMMICIALGYIITRKGMFPPQYAKGVSVLSLNIGLPSLVFGSMVSAFSPSNISAFGSLFVVAIIYEILGLVMAFICREVFYVPQDFQWGILVMGFVSNWGNLPTAVVQTIGKDLPFDGASDVELGVAYISVMILVMNTFLFPLGMHKLCALDFKEEHLAQPQLRFKERWRQRRIAFKLWLHPQEQEEATVTVESPIEEKRESVDQGESGEEPSALPGSRYAAGGAIARKTSRTPSFTSMYESTRPVPSTAPIEAATSGPPCPAPLLPVCSNHGQAAAFHHPASPVASIHKPPFSKRLIGYAKTFLMPVTVAILLGIPCSVVLPLKALFVEVDGWTDSRIPSAPDGKPPLAFIIDTVTFLGGMTIPATLILLGAAFARLKAPKRWSDQPLAAIFTMTAVKMIIVPMIGIFLVQALRNDTGLYPKSDKMRTFVAILTSGTPAAINQLVITQLYNPAGSADTLSSFLLLQYMAMPILSTALAGIGLFVADQ